MPNFKIEVKRFLKGNLVRQATEAALIQAEEGNNILNRRGEWGQNLPPRLHIEDTSGEEAKKPTKRKKGPKKVITEEAGSVKEVRGIS